MKKIVSVLLCCLMLSGCVGKPAETGIPTHAPEMFETTVEIVGSNSPVEIETETAEMIRMTVYYPDENAITFLTKTVEAEQLTFLEAMIEVDVLNDEIEVNTIIREDDHLIIDFNGAFRDLVCTMGTTGERMIIGSIVNTLIVNYGVESVSITVDSGIWESGHVVYDFPMAFFE